MVRIDWLRFTLPLAAVVELDGDLPQDLSYLDLLDHRGRDLVRQCRSVDPFTGGTGAMAVAKSGAAKLAQLLGVFEVGQVEDKGMDYYAARCPLLCEGKVVGYCLAGGKSSHQASTVHFNIFGSACLHLSQAKWRAVRDLIGKSSGHITRVDLAVDVFEGDEIDHVRSAYLMGQFDVQGKRPSQTEHGSWTLGHSRTFEVGKRQTGKCMRAYEKGDEQFGPELNDPWIRYEVEIRNSSRVIDLDVLSRPADFFAGAYPFCESLLDRLGESSTAERIKTSTRLADTTAEAAVTRLIRWWDRTCAPAMNALMSYPGDAVEHIFDRNRHRMPARLLGFARETLCDAFQKVGDAIAPASSPSIVGA